jgi:hypothetical protein
VKHHLSAPARSYDDTYGVLAVGTDIGSYGGGVSRFRTNGLWDDAETIELNAKYQTRFIRSVIEQVISTEVRTAAAAVSRWRRKQMVTASRFALTASLELSEVDAGAGHHFAVEFDPSSDTSVDDAVEKYRLFVVESSTAAVLVEQALAREVASSFWADWEGA